MDHTKIRLVLCSILSIILHILLISAFLAGLESTDSTRRPRLNAQIQASTPAPSRLQPDENVAGPAPASHQDKSASNQLGETNPTVARTSVVVPLIEDYLPTGLLTDIPSPIDSVDATPSGLKLEGVVGEIEFVLLISSEGEVDAVLLVRSSLPDVLVEYTKSAFQKARFTPGRINNIAVRSQVRILLAPSALEIEPEVGKHFSAKNLLQ